MPPFISSIVVKTSFSMSVVPSLRTLLLAILTLFVMRAATIHSMTRAGLAADRMASNVSVPASGLRGGVDGGDGDRGRIVPRRLPPTPMTTITNNATASSSCDPTWPQLAQRLQRHRKRWRERSGNVGDGGRGSGGCYDMTLRRDCAWGPPLAGIFRVRVRDGVVVEPLDLDLPTMDDLFEMAHRECVLACSSGGGPQICRAKFADSGEGSYMRSLYVNPNANVADIDMRYSVTDLQLCQETGQIAQG